VKKSMKSYQKLRTKTNLKFEMSKMNPEIDNINTFKSALKTGINIFTGAGFSTLINTDGTGLPTSNELAEEIAKKFSIPFYKDDINKTFDIASTKYGSELQSHLRRRFNVKTCNDKYYALNKINIRAYFTTNYDNIPFLIMERNEHHRLKNLNDGKDKGQFVTIPYIALHGSVLSDDSEDQLTMGNLSISNVRTERGDFFNFLNNKMNECPTLFWGYKLKDDSVKSVVLSKIKNDEGVRRKIWITFRDKDDPDIGYYRSLGCNIICGDTECILDWINNEIIDEKRKTADGNIMEIVMADNYLKKHLIPKKEEALSVTREDYYSRGLTEWLPIYSDDPIIRNHVSEVINEANGGYDVIIVGERFSGKSTILMQVARIAECPCKLYFDTLNAEETDYIIRKIGKHETWIFIENCTDDARVFVMLSAVENIHVIATANDRSFDSAKHLFKESVYRSVFITELTHDEAKEIYNKIPISIRSDRFTYKSDYNSSMSSEDYNKNALGSYSDEKFMMLEMLKNIKGSMGERRVGEILNYVFKEDPQSIELLALTTYLSWRGSALSTDVLMAYFGYKKPEEVDLAIKKIDNLLSLLDIRYSIIERDLYDQDYFILRSGLFLVGAHKIFERENKQYLHFHEIYASTVKRFVLEVAPIHIFNYRVFKRSAFDGRLFFNLFGNSADELYEFLDKYKTNPYIFQQWALYCAEKGSYKEAFILIEKALKLAPNNFSMQNSKATIMFNSSKENDSPIALQKMIDAMVILERCHKSDRRKNYHAESYANFALELDGRGESSYLQIAYDWIVELNRADRYKKIITRLRDRLKQRNDPMKSSVV